jgi:hypothetical protein
VDTLNQSQLDVKMKYLHVNFSTYFESFSLHFEQGLQNHRPLKSIKEYAEVTSYGTFYIMGDSFFDNFLRIVSLNKNLFYVTER